MFTQSIKLSNISAFYLCKTAMDLSGVGVGVGVRAELKCKRVSFLGCIYFLGFNSNTFLTLRDFSCCAAKRQFRSTRTVTRLTTTATTTTVTALRLALIRSALNLGCMQSEPFDATHHQRSQYWERVEGSSERLRLCIWSVNLFSEGWTLNSWKISPKV